MKHLAKVAAIVVVPLLQGCAAAIPALIVTGGSVVAPKMIGESLADSKLSDARKAAELRKTIDKRSCITTILSRTLKKKILQHSVCHIIELKHLKIFVTSRKIRHFLKFYWRFLRMDISY